MQQIIALPEVLTELSRKHSTSMAELFSGHGVDTSQIQNHLSMQLQQALAQPLYREMIENDRTAVLYVDAIMEAAREIPWFNAGSTNGKPCMYRCLNTVSGPQYGTAYWAECPQLLRDQYGMDRFLIIGGKSLDLVLVINTPKDTPSYVSSFVSVKWTANALSEYFDALAAKGIVKLTMFHIRAAMEIMRDTTMEEPVTHPPLTHVTEMSMVGESSAPRWMVTAHVAKDD